MQLPSFTLILSGAFIGYAFYLIYTVSLLFSPPECLANEPCFKSQLTLRPKLQLNLFTSIINRPLPKEVTKIYTAKNFDYLKESEIPLTIANPRKNGTLYLHVILSPPHLNPIDVFTSKKGSEQSHRIIRLTEYAVPQAAAYNLLGKEKSKASEELNNKINKDRPISHVRSKITFTVMTDDIELPLRDIPAEFRYILKFNEHNRFLPIIHYNFLYTRRADLIKVTGESTNVTISYNPISFGKLRLILHVEATMYNMKEIGFTAKEIDEIKSIFADTNLILLAATVFISTMHLLFDFLAFKNDISFWRSKQNLAGLSTQTVLWRAFSQAVIFLYLVDEDSVLLVLVPAGIGTIIEFWKAKKILRAEFVWFGSIFPKLRFNWSNCTVSESKTRKFDAESMRYLSYLLYPIVGIGATYSLLYQPHKSWYSWSIHSLVNGVYAFGFLFMLPQLFVNYKLKSVAHLPWRSFMYKACNTFIDDIFAFIIPMPMAHRLACFRDDAIFLVYLYQRWLYPVDITRVDSVTIDQEVDIKNNDSLKKKS